jgi:hypothetical protein
MGNQMLECMIIGDSIAVGVSQIRTECSSLSKSGINSKVWNEKYLNKLVDVSSRTLIISLGANDYKGIETEENIRKLRLRANAQTVFWLLPSDKLKPYQVEAVKKIAT